MEDMNDYYIVLGAIEKRKINIIKLYLWQCINEIGKIFNTETKIKIMNYCYDLWLDANENLSLGRLADIVADNWQDLENGELSKRFIIDKILGY